ncbi:hypothetical protein ACSLBF_17750 (plasmid) [Pseudoalteromonas sp. T1lg65]|uniref:hypothetical protein n=1 Tax=Pseudoalteromonas sp. T1lg65 TaxID=2077101 RepID=UPI003F798E7A
MRVFLLLIFVLLSSVVSLQSFATSSVTELNPVTPIWPKPWTCCELLCPRDVIPSHAMSIEEVLTAAEMVVQPTTPILIDAGVRYSLSKLNFMPVYVTRVAFKIDPDNPCSPPERVTYSVLSGYEATIMVDGDDGQELFFDIFGQSDKSLDLSVSCGSFSAQDTGNKWTISERKTTNGSCSALSIRLTDPTVTSLYGSLEPADFINLSVIISTAF